MGLGRSWPGQGIVTAWTDSANVIPPGGKERSETPTSGVIMARQRESNVDYPIGMLARQRATNLNSQSNWTGMRIRARGDGKRDILKIVRCHEVGLAAPLGKTSRPEAVIVFNSKYKVKGIEKQETSDHTIVEGRTSHTKQWG